TLGPAGVLPLKTRALTSVVAERWSSPFVASARSVGSDPSKVNRMTSAGSVLARRRVTGPEKTPPRGENVGRGPVSAALFADGCSAAVTRLVTQRPTATTAV